MSRSLALVRPSIDELRRLVEAKDVEPGERTSFSLHSEGLAPGCLIEISGEGKTSWLAQFLKEHQEFKTAWIESHLTVYPYALLQKGVRLENLLFVEAGEALGWALGQVLAASVFQVVVFNGSNFHEKELRRGQLLAEKARAHLFLLSDHPHQSWVPSLQLEVRREHGEWRTQVWRKRGGA